MTAIFTGLGAGAERGSGNVLGGAGLLGSGTFGRSGEQVLLNAATGNLMIQQRDEMLVGRGPDAAITRTYNSQGDLSDDNGDNWRQSTDRRVYGLTGTVSTSGSTVKRVSADGSEITYAWNATASAYVATDGAGAYDKLTWNAGTSVWTWTDGDSQLTETYAHASGASYFITAATDTSGNMLAFSYVTSTDKIDKVTTADGGYVQYSWSGNNITQITTGYTDLVTSTAKTLTRTRYGYDGSNRLTSVTVDLSPDDNSIADGKTYVTTYTYDGSSKRVASISQTDGSSLAISYDGSFRVTSLVQTVASGVTRTTSIAYDATNKTATVTDPSGQATILAYDASDQLTRITTAAGQVTQFAYNGNGDVVSTTDAMGNAATFASFTAFGNAQTITDREGNVTTRTFGSKNELLTETVTGADQSGGAVAHTTRFVYDSNDRLTFTINADGDVTQSYYEGNGQIWMALQYTGERYPLGSLTSSQAPTLTQMNSWVSGLSDPTTVNQQYIQYDARGNATTIIGFDKSTSPGVTDNDAGYSHITYVYDQAGQLLSRTDYAHTSEQLVYDGLGRVVASVDMQGSTTSILFDDSHTRTVVTLANGLTQTSTYNKAGDLLAYTQSGPLDGATNLAPNLSNTGQWTSSGATVTSAGTIGGAAATQYTAQTTGAGAGLATGPYTVAAGDTLTWEITLKGVGTNLSDMLGFYGTVSDWGDTAHTTATVLSGPGTVTNSWASVMQVSGLSTTTETRIRITRSFTVAETAYGYFYVNSSNGAAVTAGNAVILASPTIIKTTAADPQIAVATAVYTYDALGRVRAAVDATGHNSYVVYDNAGRRVADVDHDRALTEYKYDADNRVIATVRYATALSSSYASALAAGTFTLDASSRPADNAADLWTFKIYDKEGRVVEAIDGTGDATAYTYDASGKLTQTTSYANKLTTTQIASLKATASGGNVAPDLTNGSQWSVGNLAVTSVGGGAYRYGIQTSGGGGEVITTGPYTVAAGTTLTFEITATGVNSSGTIASAYFGFYGNTTSGWGDGTDTTIAVISGPGSVTTSYLAIKQLGSLDTGTPTRFRITRTFTAAETVTGYLYIDSTNSTTVAGHAVILAAPSISRDATTAVTLPTADSAHDQVSRLFYDKTGRVVGTLDGEGYLSRITYDGIGRKVAETFFATIVPSGDRASASFNTLITDVGTTSADRTTRWVYDNQGQLTFTVDALNHVTELVYPANAADVIGEARQSIRYNGAIAALSTYSVASVRTAITTAGIASDSGNRIGWAVYDVHENLTYAIDASGAVTGYVYDAMGHVTRTTRYATLRSTTSLPSSGTMDGWVASYANSTSDRVTRDYYDARGNMTFTIDAEGYVTRLDYDAESRLVGTVRWNTAVSATDSTTLAGVAGLVGGTCTATGIAYDNDGRVVSTTDGEGVVTTYVYNANGTLNSTYSAYGTADQVRTYFLYDAAGRVTSRYDAYGASEQTLTQYAYDGFGQVVTTTDPNGNTLTASYDRLGRVLSQTDQEALTTSYQYNAFGDRIAVTDPRSGTGYAYYDVLGRVIATRDVANRVTETAYNVFGDVASVTQRYSAASGGTGSAPSVTPDTARDAVTSFTYDKIGRWLTSTDAESAVTTATYNAFGEIATRTDPFAGSTTIQTSLTYDRRGLLKTQVVDSAGGGKAITTTYGYDAFGRAITLTDANSKVTTSTYDKDGRLLTTTDALSHTTTYTYDARGNLAAVTDALGNVTRYVYDKLGRRIVTIDALGAVSTNSYDADGNLVATRDYLTTITLTGMPLKVSAGSLTLPATNAGDAIARYAYDKDGRLVYSIDALMHVAKYQNDGDGNVNRIVRYDGTIGTDSSGLYTTAWIASTVASSGLSATNKRIDRSIYDAANQLTYAIDANGQVTRYFYDSFGQVIKKVDYVAPYTATDDPSVGTMDSWATSNASSSNDRLTRAYYDRDGRLAYSVDALGYVTRIEYDKAGHAIKQTAYADAYSASDSTTLANLNSNYTTPPSTARTTQFNYDTAGRLVETIDPEGFSTKLVLDQMGRITSSTAAYGLTAAVVTTFAYDDVGRVTSTTRGDGATTTAFTYDSLDRVTQTIVAYGTADEATTRVEYDAVGRVTKQTRGYGTADAADTLMAYDAFGRVTTTTDARGSVVANTYDVLDELLTRTQQLETGTTDDQVTTFTYDNFGNAVKTVDARGNASFAYFDKLDRVTRQVDAEKYVTDTAYTRGGQVASVKRWANALTGTVVETTMPSNPMADSTHDATTTFTYDKADRLTATQDAEAFSESYTLDAFGERTTVTNKLGGASTYTFDKRGLLLTETLPITTKNGSGTTIYVVNSYSYDARGNRTQMVEAYGAVEARTTSYAYDKLDRLTTTTHDAVTVVNDDLTSTSTVTVAEQIKYDRRGNVIETIDAAGAHGQIWYDDLDRAIARVVQTDIVSGTAKGTLTRLVYDANGNVVSTRAYGDLITVPSDATGSIPSPVGSTNYRETTYAYDRADRLTTTSVASLLTGEWNGSSYATTTGSVVTTLYYDKNGNVTRQQDARGNSIYSWYDKLGRKTAQVDAETYLTTWTLDAEGNALSETRFATAVGSFTPGSSAPTVSTNAADRTTIFSYDKNGRRLQEQRSGVAYASINTSNGALTTATATSTITYTYNGLGEVLTKVEANGDTTGYTYDTTGRLTLETGQSFTDYLGSTVTPRTAYAYDGLNNLKSTRVQKAATANDTDDRITTYTYSAGGRLATMTDASGFVHTYGYDVAGRTVRDSYVRVKSDASSVTEALVYRYDLAGRVTTQTNARLSGSTWVFTDAASVAYDAVRMRYDAYGAVTGRGVTAGPGATAAYQEVFDYDTGGRLWHSNSGDGVDRFYVYDQAGNQTLTLTSTGADLSALTLANYTASLTSSGDTSTSGAVTTITVLDRNGQATATRAPDRELTAIGSGTVTLFTARTYNAFGEVASETDARGFDASGAAVAGHTTTFTYNNMGRLIQKVSPQVSVTAESGTVSNANPTESYGYDLSGRLVAVTDANSHVTTRLLLAGTGHGDGEAQVTKEFHAVVGSANAGVFETRYDVFGDARILRNELYSGSNATASDQVQSFDKLGRLSIVVHRGALLTDTYGYDGLGQRTSDAQSWSGGSQTATTDYDAQGRVVRTQAFALAGSGVAGDITTTVYDWSGSLRRQTLTYAAGTAGARGTIDLSDTFGHVTSHTDMGGVATAFTYDLGGRLTERNIGGGTETQRYTYYNTGLAASWAGGTGSGGGFSASATAAYTYDANGRKLTEKAIVAGVTTQNATATYDALGRTATWAEAGTALSGTSVSVTPASDMAWGYDAVGNVRTRTGHLTYLDTQGAPAWGGSLVSNSGTFLYDSMNRMTSSNGTAITYNAAGQRMSASGGVMRTVQVANPGFQPEDPVKPWNQPYVTTSYWAQTIEYYDYDDAGNLTSVRIAEGGYTDNENGTATGNAPSGSGQVKSTFSFDALGRQYRQQDWTGDGSGVAFDRQLSYDAKGRVSSETDVQKQGADTLTTYVSNYFLDGASGYAMGAVTSSSAAQYKNGSYLQTTGTATSYGWYDQAVMSQVDYTPNTSSPGTVQHSYYTNGATGVLKSVSVVDGRSRSITLTNDALGQALRRDEADGNTSTGDPHEIWYRFDGKQIGYLGNNDSDNISYADSIGRRTTASTNGPFKNGQTYGLGVVDFDQAYEAVNSYQQGSGGGSYTVRDGDTLAGIAAQLWGDAGLWYKLADANGLSAGGALSAGQSLRVPSGVMRSTNSASTFNPYDVSDAYGDSSPTTPQPQKAAKNKCGTFGIILLVVIAVAVTVVSAGAAVAALGPAGTTLGTGIATVLGTAGGLAGGVAGALGGGLAGAVGAVAIGAGSAALGSIVSQGFGLATGIQQGGFNWKAVALAGLTGAISGGVGAIGQGGKAAALSAAAKGAAGTTANVATTTVTSALGHIAQTAGKFAVGALRGAAISAATQGIAKITGLQDEFDWGGVASAAIGGGLANSIKLPGGRVVNSVAGRIAGVGAASLVTGTDFGDNLMHALPDIIGQTIGDLVSGAIGRAANHGRDIAAERRAAPSEGPEEPSPNAPVIGEDWGDPGTIGMPNLEVETRHLMDMMTLNMINDSNSIVGPGNNTAALTYDQVAERMKYGDGTLDYKASALSPVGMLAIDGPQAGKRWIPEQARWVDPYFMQDAKGNYIVDAAGKPFYGRYETDEVNKVSVWANFGSPDEWRDAQLRYGWKSFKTAMAQGASQAAAGVGDVVVGLKDTVVLVADTLSPVNLPGATERWQQRKETAKAIYNDPTILLRAALEPMRQLMEEGSIRGFTSMVVGSAIGARFVPTTRFVPRSFQTEMRIGVTANIAKSQAARAASGFEQFSTRAAAVERASAGAVRVRTAGTVSSRAAVRAAPAAARASLVSGGRSAGSASVRAPTGKIYSVAYETKIDPSVFGKGDSVHFNRANAALDNALQSDPGYAAAMEEMIPGVRASVSRVGGRQNPEGWTWHHDVEPGTMQLVPSGPGGQHTPGSIFWDTLHPNGVGGYALWARPAGAPRR